MQQNKLSSVLEAIGLMVPASVDYKSHESLELARDMADMLLGAEEVSLEIITDFEKRVSGGEQKSSYSNLVHLAIKLAKSRLSILSAGDIQISVVMPAYGENTRMMPRGEGPGKHPMGENFIVEKNLQLEWLFRGTEARYQVYIVDDMSKADPILSGDAAQIVINANSVKNFKVLYLEQGVRNIASSSPLVRCALNGVNIPKNTKKAGAVYLGAAIAIEEHGESDRHVVVLTDCDLSVDLGQIGNLIHPIVANGRVSGVGSRRLPESILEIAGGRNLRANTARYFRQLLLPGLLPKDTQCGAKAVSSRSLAQVIRADRQVLDFAFDIELLALLAIQNGPEKLEPVAVAWFDSAELTTTDSSVHLGIMKAQLAIAVSNELGVGNKHFSQLVRLSETLTESEEVWLSFLTMLESRPDLQEAMQGFDTSIVAELTQMVQAA